jgi:regulator-associated protein of mTOR
VDFPPSPAPPPAQVLLSQTHRHRALVLLAKFLDKGAWAVNQALSVGIFPYVLKLLQSPAAELRDVLVFIWAKVCTCVHSRTASVTLVCTCGSCGEPL